MSNKTFRVLVSVNGHRQIVKIVARDKPEAARKAGILGAVVKIVK